MKENGYDVGKSTISSILQDMGYSLQVNKKSLGKSSHSDRDAQFNYINQSIIKSQNKLNPTISIDTKKKENLGNFKNNGKIYSQKGKPIEVNDHDFPSGCPTCWKQVAPQV